MRFKAGDKIRCTESSSYTPFSVGKTYEVAEVTYSGSFVYVVADDEGERSGGWYGWRFELVPPASKYRVTEQRTREFRTLAEAIAYWDDHRKRGFTVTISDA